MNQQLYREFHEQEWAFKNQITTNIAIPIGGLSIVGGLLFSMIGGFPYGQSSLTYIFVISSFCSAVALLFSIYCVFRCQVRFKYELLGSAVSFYDYQIDIADWCRETETEIKIGEERFNEWLTERYVMAATHNRYVNKLRSGYLNKATLSLAISLLLLGVAAIPQQFERIKSAQSIVRVEVLNTELQTKSNGGCTNE